MSTSQNTPLKELLGARGLTLMQFAVAAGTNESTVSRWCHRDTPPAERFRRNAIRKLKLTDEELAALGWPEAKEAARV